MTILFRKKADGGLEWAAVNLNVVLDVSEPVWHSDVPDLSDCTNDRL